MKRDTEKLLVVALRDMNAAVRELSDRVSILDHPAVIKRALNSMAAVATALDQDESAAPTPTPTSPAPAA